MKKTLISDEPVPDASPEPSTHVRVFLAVELDQEVRDSVADVASRLRKGALFTSARIVWVPPENYHVTLWFLGEIPRGRADKIARTLPEVAGGIQGFDLDIRRIGTFPDEPRTPPRVLWMDCHRPSPMLELLRQRCASAILRAGLKLPDQEFSPHVTLARFKSTRGLREFRAMMQDYLHVKAGRCPVTRVVLMQSITGGGQARYVPYATGELAPAPEKPAAAEETETP